MEKDQCCTATFISHRTASLCVRRPHPVPHTSTKGRNTAAAKETDRARVVSAHPPRERSAAHESRPAHAACLAAWRRGWARYETKETTAMTPTTSPSRAYTRRQWRRRHLMLMTSLALPCRSLREERRGCRRRQSSHPSRRSSSRQPAKHSYRRFEERGCRAAAR